MSPARASANRSEASPTDAKVTPKRAPARQRVAVQYMGLLRQAAGIPEETLLVPAGATVNDVLALVKQKHDGLQAQAFDGQGVLLPNIHLFLNDDEIEEDAWARPIPRKGQLAMLLMLHPIEGG